MSGTGLSLLLQEVEGFVRRFVVMSDEQAVAIVLWIAHTHAVEASEFTPYLAVTSATKRSGKSKVLDVAALLVRSPLRAGGVTEAALFRSLGGAHPVTLLMDEVDAIFGPKARDHEDVRALLNNGFQRGTPVLRCVGEGSKQRVGQFDVFGAKALAGIGELPDTVADRSLPIRLKRRARTEPIERFRVREAREPATAIREQLTGWAEDVLDELAAARPELPDELDDRAQDVVECLVAIADRAGGVWPERARRAFVLLRAEQAAADEDALGVRLLRDVRTAFTLEQADKLATDRLLELLVVDEEAPWSEWYGKPITARGLSKLLRPFGVRPRTIRLDDGTTPKGYRVAQFEDVWSRYPPETAPENATSATTAWLSQEHADVYPPHTLDVADTKTGANPHQETVVARVADNNGETDAARQSNGRFGAANEAGIQEATPVPGDPDYHVFVDLMLAAGHVTERERREMRLIHNRILRARSPAGERATLADVDALVSEGILFDSESAA